MHGEKYANFYDYKEDCNNWIEETIDDLSKKGGPVAKSFFEKAQALKDSCEPWNLIVPKQAGMGQGMKIWVDNYRQNLGGIHYQVKDCRIVVHQVNA